MERQKYGKIETAKSPIGIRRGARAIPTSERAMFLLQITAIKFLGYLNLEISERQTKVTQRVKTRHSCHGIQRIKSVLHS